MKTLGDLEKAMKEIGLPIKVSHHGATKTWVAQIEWSAPDYTDHAAVGEAESMLDAIVQCLEDYRGQTK